MRLLPSISLSRLAFASALLAGGLVAVTVLTQSSEPEPELTVCGTEILADPAPTPVEPAIDPDTELERRAAEEPHHLSIETQPSGATVIVNDRVIGKTPFKGVLPTQDLDLSIQLRLDGYVPILLPVSVLDNFARCEQGFCLVVDENLTQQYPKRIGDFPPHPRPALGDAPDSSMPFLDQ